MLIALTGTPGTGKTTISSLLQKEGYNIINLNEFAINQGCISYIDKKTKTSIIDIDKLNINITEKFRNNNLYFFDGHASHLIKSIDRVIILRCHPEELKNRLKNKGYTRNKIMENIEAETIDVILCETVEHYNEDQIFEIETTHKTIKSVFLAIIEIINNNFKPMDKYRIGKIDWSEEILKKYQ
jgi:adenylate kinase